jgi:hypothetical protein
MIPVTTVSAGTKLSRAVALIADIAYGQTGLLSAMLLYIGRSWGATSGKLVCRPLSNAKLARPGAGALRHPRLLVFHTTETRGHYRTPTTNGLTD